MANAVSFFAGAGGLDTGIMLAGFEIKLTVEIEETFCETLRLNHPNTNVLQGDIMQYDRERIYREANLNNDEEIDLIIGGSPCQSFSTAGNRQAFSDPRGQAMLKFAQLVTESRPKVFMLENVRGLLSAALRHRPLNQRGAQFPPLEEDEMPGSAVEYLLSHFEGYRIKMKLINSANYGVPQKRERVFFIGVREDINIDYEFPIETHNELGNGGKEAWKTLGQVLSALDVNQHHFVEYTPERLQYMRLIPQGGGYWRDLPQDRVRQAMGGAYESGGGKVGFYRRLNVSKPSPTLLTSPNQKSTNLGHPYEDRPLSIEEYLAIQEFPNGYRLAGTLMQQYTQVGNAVPVRLARVLGESVMSLIRLEQEINQSRLQVASN